MKKIVFDCSEFSDRELRKIWRSLCNQRIGNDVLWESGAKKLESVTIELK